MESLILLIKPVADLLEDLVRNFLPDQRQFLRLTITRIRAGSVSARTAKVPLRWLCIFLDNLFPMPSGKTNQIMPEVYQGMFPRLIQWDISNIKLQIFNSKFGTEEHLKPCLHSALLACSPKGLDLLTCYSNGCSCFINNLTAWLLGLDQTGKIIEQSIKIKPCQCVSVSILWIFIS